MPTDGHQTTRLVEAPIGPEDLADPTQLYRRATRSQAVHAAAARDLSRLRARAVAQLHDEGMSYAQIADHLGGLSRARVQQLVEQGRGTAGAAAAPRPGSVADAMRSAAAAIRAEAGAS